MANKAITMKVTKLENSDWDNIEHLYEVLELKEKLLHGIEFSVLDVFELMKIIENNTVYLKTYPEYVRAKYIFDRQIKFKVPKHQRSY